MALRKLCKNVVLPEPHFPQIETEKAIKEISIFVGLLSDYYIKDRTEGLKFEDDDM